MTPLAVTAWTATTAVGRGNAALLDALVQGRGGLRPNDFTADPLDTHVGRVAGLESIDWPRAWRNFDCRNNRLAWLGVTADGMDGAVAAASARYGASRVALVLGTSTASIGASEAAYTRLEAGGLFPPDLRHPELHTPHSTAHFLAEALAIDGPAVTVSTACSSSAKAFAQAERMIRLGLVDAALAGGTEGGITTGELLVVRAAMKPLATLNQPTLATVDVVTKQSTVSFKERTDVTAVPAMGVVAETMVALVLAGEAQRKFGGDSLGEFVRNATAFRDTLRDA